MPPRVPRTSERGGARGVRGGAAAREGASASSTASADAPVQSHEEEVPAATAPAPAPETGGDAGSANAPERAITIDSKSSTPTPVPSARGRFKPKNIRRDANERQQLEEQRQRELAAKVKIEEKEQRDADRRARRGGAGRGRGRGDSSRGGFIKRTGPGHGPFSGDGKQGAGWGFGKSSSGPYSGGGAKVEGSHRYHDRKANEPRVNVDTLHRSPSPGPGHSGERAHTTLPFRIERHEFKKEDAKVATSAELAAEEQMDDDEDDSLFVPQENGTMVGRDIEIAAATDTKAWHAHPAGQEAKVKAEPGTGNEDAMDIDAIPAIPKPPPSPEQKKKPMAEQLASREQAKERKREKASQDPEVLLTAWERQTIKQELSVEPTEDGFYLEKDGRLHLFQFPLVLPPLARAAEDDNTANGSGGAPGSSGPQTAESALPPAGGYLGKLNIRKSGKVELDWGGIPFEMGLGMQTSFLTTAMIVDEAENDMVAGQGKATGMGEIYNKFILTPIWGEEEDWNPSLEGLNLEDE